MHLKVLARSSPHPTRRKANQPTAFDMKRTLRIAHCMS
jgi:hypothetical protein